MNTRSLGFGLIATETVHRRVPVTVRKKPMLRCHQGSKNPNAKLTESLVREIRNAEGNQREIGARFGINKSTVSRIKRREHWPHVE